MKTNEITGTVIDAAIHIHKQLGPGLLESVYEVALETELQRRGLKAIRQVPVSFEFEGRLFVDAYRIDILVEEQVVLEIKSVELLAPVHFKQVLTYLKLSDLRVGLLLNFGAATLKEGLKRVVNNFEDEVTELDVALIGELTQEA